MGLRTRILNATRGEATLFHHFSAYGPYRGEMGGRQNGSMIAMATDKSVAYGLDALQTRGRLFIGPALCYEGMIVGEHAKENDLVVNVAKGKQLTNMRAASADKGILLAPPITFTLEEALEYIEDDELVEITPKSIRLRPSGSSTAELAQERGAGPRERALVRRDGRRPPRAGRPSSGALAAAVPLRAPARDAPAGSPASRHTRSRRGT